MQSVGMALHIAFIICLHFSMRRCLPLVNCCYFLPVRLNGPGFSVKQHVYKSVDWCLHYSVNCRLIASKLIHKVTVFIMGWTALSCALIATFLTMLADPVVSSPQEYRPPDPEPAAVFNSGKAVKREALQQLRDYMKEEDSLLHDLRKESFSTLRELVKEGDGNVQDRLLLGLAGSKDRDDQLKEELDEDVAWLKDQLTKGQRRLNEELAEEEARRKEELTEQKENLDNLRSSAKQRTESSSAIIDDLKKQMTDFQEELKSTKQQLQTTQTELETSQRNLQSMQEIVRSNPGSIQSSQSIQAALKASQEKVSSIEEELQKTCDQLRHQEQAFTAVQTQLQDEVRSLKVEVDSLQSSYALLNSSELGSTFTRWGRTTCPNNTSLVYSGVAGGSWYNHPGGGSNYLCLVMDPQLDNVTNPSGYVDLYGAEYQRVEGHHHQDVVCSVCRAPQTTTLMIPATLTCPPGWSVQYTGYLISEHSNVAGGKEFICMDDLPEDREGGEADEDGALFYHVKTRCGSLPCPPYADEKTVTCVVCSM